MTRLKLYLAMANLYIQLIYLVFLLPVSALAQNNGTVPNNSTLTAGETSSYWLSPSGEFAFGFQQLQEKDLFLFSIWYHKIPDKTVVWYVNTINSVPRNSTVVLDGQIGLVLRNPQGSQLWTTDVNSNQVNHGFMNNTGNFILKGSDDSWLWESFKFPSDTILPNQGLAIGNSLSSRQSATNFSQGRFYLHFDGEGNLVLATRSVPTNEDDEVQYYNSQTSSSTDALNSGYQVTFDGTGAMYIRKTINQTQQLNLVAESLPQASEYYHRATIDFYGVFTHYYHPRTFTGNPNWTIFWYVPINICYIQGEMGSGACGFNSVCYLEDNGRPACKCPNGYILLDPKDAYGSCIPNSSLGCGEVEGSAESLFDLEVVNDINWPLSDYERIYPSEEPVCKQSCLQDCFCAVAIFSGSGCWKKRLPLGNGRAESTGGQSKAFIKYRKSDAPPVCQALPPVGQTLPPVLTGSKPKNRGTVVLVGSLLLGSSFFVNLVFIATACFGFHFIYHKKKVITHPNTDALNTNLRYFAYKELAEATNEFKEELGRGSFGTVYKGDLQIRSKNTTFAVKKLCRVDQDADKEFRAEVESIGRTNHKNLVHLLGFCDEGQHRLLVYEYMSGGTLARLLLNNPKPSWSMRTQIAIGIARGLVYLHEECNTQIIHCDIKPQNVLLDEYFNARISDFGLAKLLMINQSRTFTSIRGTKGYVAPEWFRSNQITAKVDVYSFGVLLLEIISCRRCVENIENFGEGENPILIDWAWDCFQEGRMDMFVENDLEALEDKTMLERFLMVAIWCIQENSSLRPKMRKVSQMLEGIVEVMVPPCPSPFSTTG
ncbi:G-type lectin S-receptor-like serine/threonine-protein kinase RLK1 [Coffea arabica]|uniref:Receptor-like serine/threonine-protein kinase n=1 Tax=Coffea arabica TaxID=13443 RepID=A0A6P6SPE8_COFAR